ncbi:MAG: PD-(D/E)XK nuclease family protein [Clostridia bacterium]|nr:PD-(D/E)XK nuclease family protein [Clostridia bacterium]
MLYRIFGSAGSGKTEYMLRALGEAAKKGIRCWLIVPEQQSVAYESLLCERFGDGINLVCETLNFERLPNRVAREYGGLAVNNIDKGGACALLSLTAEGLRDKLKEYSAVASDADFAKSLLALSERIKTCMVTPEMLESAAEDASLSDDPALCEKLKELALILKEYGKNFGEGLLDPRDALTKLAAELPEKPFFKNSCVFIDGYYNFTAQEHAVISAVSAQCRDIYVSFTVDGDRAFFAENLRSADIIKRTSGCGCADVPVGKYRRGEKDSLRFLESHIWGPVNAAFRGDDGGVKFILAGDRFEECEAAAAEILAYVRAGGRWRDITVLAGAPDSYTGIVDPVFERAGIKCYISAHEPLLGKPLFSFMLSSLAVVAENFSLRSVKRYIKSGYSGLSVSESDILLGYAESWNVSGAGWYGEAEWTMDPEGYREGGMSERGAKILKIASAAREKLVPPLAALREALSVPGLTVERGVKAIYNHLIACGADEKLRVSAQRKLENGDREGSDREAALWKQLMNILDQLYSVCGPRVINAKRMYSLVKLVCENYAPGAIPASSDSVTFGDASLVRAGGCGMLILLGVCDGEFPRPASRGAFFDRDEAAALEGAGLELADTTEKAVNTGRFLVYSAFAAPKRKLVLCCPCAELAGDELRPSAAFVSARAMLPDAELLDTRGKKSPYSAESVASAFPYLAQSPLRDKIAAALDKRGEKYFTDAPAVFDPESRIDFESDTLLLSPSRFERYALCPFSFFGNYLLGLKEKKKNDWSAPEIGNFIHKILEQFMRRCVESGRFVCFTDAERRALVRELAKEYFLDVIGEANAKNKRFAHTYENMIRTLDLVTKSMTAEFAESRFTPAGFEFRIGIGEADLPPVRYDTESGRVLLRGSIDRVDVYVRNGVTYVRVIDYKTYKKRLRADLVACGLDTQMLHYLFAYCGAENAVPAGVLYYTVALPSVEISGEESDAEILEKAEKALTREGLLLNDPEIVFAMSESLRFVPVSRRADGSIYDRGKRLRTPEEFDALRAALGDAVNELANRVFAGDMDIAPREEGDPCKYCRLQEFCRASGGKGEDDGTDEDAE